MVTSGRADNRRGFWPPGGRLPARRMSRATFSAAARANSVATLGIGVGGEGDRRVPELVLDHFQVRAGGQGEGGRAVPQTVQGDRRQRAAGDEAAEDAG